MARAFRVSAWSRAVARAAASADAIARCSLARQAGTPRPTITRHPIETAPITSVRRSRAESDEKRRFIAHHPARCEIVWSRDRVPYPQPSLVSQDQRFQERRDLAPV